MMKKLSSITKSRKFYIFLCGVILLGVFVKAQIANSATPIGITVQSFTNIEFVDDKCWNVSVGSGNVVYTNACFSSSFVVLTLLDGITKRDFLVAPGGRLILLGGSVVHIIRETP